MAVTAGISAVALTAAATGYQVYSTEQQKAEQKKMIKQQEKQAAEQAKKLEQEQAEMDEQMANEARLSQADSARDDSAAGRQRIAANNAMGASDTILTSPLGVPNLPQQSGKTLLGG